METPSFTAFTAGCARGYVALNFTACINCRCLLESESDRRRTWLGDCIFPGQIRRSKTIRKLDFVRDFVLLAAEKVCLRLVLPGASAANLKPNSSAGWPVKAVTSEPSNPGSPAELDDEAEMLKRQELFNTIAPMYDNLNDWLSLGQHRVWKRMAVSWAGAKAGETVLDICCGSGDLAFLLAQKVGPSGKVIGLDFAKEQLVIAADRQQDSPRTSAADMEWIQGDALSLPFEDSSFDAITMGYGLRNVTNIPQALAEIYRVLKPGRKASVLDFNRSPDLLTGEVQGFVLDNVVVPVATYFGVREEYAYLKTSIARFPLGAEQERLAADEGFSKAVHYELAGGLMGVLVATK